MVLGSERDIALQRIDQRQGRTPLLLFVVGAFFVLLPLARFVLPERFTEYLPGVGLTQFALGLLFFYVGALIFERQRLNASFRELLDSFDGFLRGMYGDDYRERMQAIAVLIRALGSEDASVRAKSHAQLVRLSGQEFPAEREPWEAWWRANRMGFLAQRGPRDGGTG